MSELADLAEAIRSKDQHAADALDGVAYCLKKWMDRVAARDTEIQTLVKERNEAHQKAETYSLANEMLIKQADELFNVGREAGIREAAALFADEATDETAEGWTYIDVVRRILALLENEPMNE